jgi:hypothetical protein
MPRVVAPDLVELLTERGPAGSGEDLDVVAEIGAAPARRQSERLAHRFLYPQRASNSRDRVDCRVVRALASTREWSGDGLADGSKFEARIATGQRERDA